VIVVKLSAPVYTKGNYTIFIQPGINNGPIYDVCGQPILPQTLPFNTVDTVSAKINYTGKYGCQRDTLTFSHDAAHDVNQWSWTFNNSIRVNTQTHTIIFPAASTDTITLFVSNGVCTDSSLNVLVLDNQVKALFDAATVVCPGDTLGVKNNSIGSIDQWLWQYDVFSTSTVKDPPPYIFPDNNNREVFANIKLVATNTVLHCSDSIKHYVRILNNCFIAVPTAFTPNGDGLNDYFWPHNAYKADNLDFKVFNRWGQLVFKTSNWQVKWDGKINGVMQSTGVYVWFLSYTNRDTKQTVFQKGTVTLIR
jgi:gliding motility-associated-like protein